MSSNCAAYATVKYVEIHDARLGILRYLLLFAIILYVGVFEMWAMGGYLESSPVVGVVRFSLQQPTVHNCDPYSQKGSCSNAFSPVNTLPYCQQYYQNDTAATFSSKNTTTYVGNVYPCEIYEATNAQIVSEKSIAIITRASTTNQTLVCSTSSSANNDAWTTTTTCPRTYNDTSSEYKFYTAQSEAFTILLDHAVSASKICSSSSHADEASTSSYTCSAQSSQFQGRLYSKHDALCKQEYAKGNAFQSCRGTSHLTDTAPCYIQPNQTKSTNQDFFSLDVLLMAAGGVNLDDCNNASSTSAPSSSSSSSCQTYRDTGATVLLNIYWSDFNAYEGRVEPYYYYSPQLIAGSSFKQYIPFYNNNYRQSRTLLNAHGIKLAVLLGGEFNQFDIVAFMVTLTTALGLLAVATAIVDNLMLYVLPEKQRYQEVKYERTEEVFQSGDSVGVLNAAVAGFQQLVNSDNVASGNGDDGQASNSGSTETTNENDGLNEPLL